MFTAPYPGVAVPECGEQMEPAGLWAAVAHSDIDEDVIGSSFGILCKHVPVAALIKDAGVLQLKLWLMDSSSSVLLHQLRVGVLTLRILVECLHVGVCGRGVEVIITLLAILPMIALCSCQPKQPLLQEEQDVKEC